MINRLTKTMFVYATLFASCGGGNDEASTADDRKLSDLTQEETRSLCDWVAEQWGGYGKEHDCGDGSSAVAPTKDECLEGPRTCSATVAQAKSCIKAIVRDKCSESFEFPSECETLPADCSL